MNRPPFEVADIVRAAGQKFIDKNRSWLTGLHRKVLFAIECCRTAALGGHKDRCARCGYKAISYNSCRNRHCPKCQTNAREKWLTARRGELLEVPYVHVVFTLPHQLASLAYYNKKPIYSLLFRASAATLLEVAADPKHLGAEIGFLSVLHTWGQNLLHHPHVHCVIPAGGLSPDHQRWVRTRYAFFLPVKVLSRVFRGKFVGGLKQLFRDGELSLPGPLKPLAREKAFRSFLRSLFRQDWVVYAKPPFGGPHHVLQYLARYTHRVAISNHRLVNFADGKVTFRWNDYAHGRKKRLMTLSTEEFLRRFLLHWLPRGFVRIRFFGFLANRRRAKLLPCVGSYWPWLPRRSDRLRAASQSRRPGCALTAGDPWPWSKDSRPTICSGSWQGRTALPTPRSQTEAWASSVCHSTCPPDVSPAATFIPKTPIIRTPGTHTVTLFRSNPQSTLPVQVREHGRSRHLRLIATIENA